MNDEYAQLRESLKNGEFDFGAQCCGNGVWGGHPDNPLECCGQPITYADIIQSLLEERDAMKATLEEALVWHEAQDKAISKQPNANTGHKGWMRAQHQEQVALISAALAQE